MKSLFFLTALMLVSCDAISQTAGSVKPGSYVLQGETDTYLGLVKDGKSVSLTKFKDGSWKLIMIFKWSVAEGKFCQKDIAWTSDGKNFFKQPDTCTNVRINGDSFSTQTISGGWVLLEPTDHDPIREVSAATAIRFPEPSR